MKQWPPGAPVGQEGEWVADPGLHSDGAGRYVGSVSFDIVNGTGSYPGTYVYTVTGYRVLGMAWQPVSFTQDVTVYQKPIP